VSALLASIFDTSANSNMALATATSLVIVLTQRHGPASCGDRGRGMTVGHVGLACLLLCLAMGASVAEQDDDVSVATAGACDPNYEGACIPIASDVDCAGGSGNGPVYVRGPLKIIVVGRDIYDLDRDSDGVICEPKKPKRK
jgi:hypothetical protein